MRYNRSNESHGFMDGVKDGIKTTLGITIAFGIAVFIASVIFLGYQAPQIVVHLLPVLFVIFVAVLILSPVKRVERDNQ